MKKFLSLLFVFLFVLAFVPAVSAEGTSYYVDAVNGDDAASGTSPETAWRTLEKASAVTYSAGDKILLRRGQVFGPLFHANGSGTAEAPIVFSAYGEGARPVIRNEEPTPTFVIFSVSGWIVEDVEFTAPTGSGVYIFSYGDTDVEDITVRRCSFRDIAPQERSTGNAAIGINMLSDTARIRRLRLEDLTIENVAWGIHMNGLNAESRDGSFKNPDESYNSDFLLQNIYIENAACGGIVIASVQDCTVRNCRVLNCATAQDDYYAPLWMRHTNRTTVEYCEIAGSTNRRDGMAIDFDGWTTNSTYRYIYSHDNTRFMRNCVFDAKTRNAGNCVEHCVSVNDSESFNYSAATLISARRPSFSRMTDFRFADSVIVGAKPIIWTGTAAPEVSGITFSGSPIRTFLQRFFNLFIKTENFSFRTVEQEELDGLIAEITANLPEKGD